MIAKPQQQARAPRYQVRPANRGYHVFDTVAYRGIRHVTNPKHAESIAARLNNPQPPRS